MELMNFLKLMSFNILDEGWKIVVECPEKDKNKIPITKEVWFPKVPLTKKIGVNIIPVNQSYALYTRKAFGEFEIDGFVKFLPKFNNSPKNDHKGTENLLMALDSRFTKNSKRWTYETGELYTRTSNGSPVDKMAMGFKEPLTKKYPLTYVWTKEGWIPELLFEAVMRLNKNMQDLAQEEAFNQEFKQATDHYAQLQVLKRHTVQIQEAASVQVQETKKIITIPSNGEVGGYRRVENARRAPEKVYAPEPVITFNWSAKKSKALV